MPVITSPEEFNTEDLYVDLRPVLGSPVYLKCEGFNFAGSIKLKAAATMVEEAEKAGLLTRDSILVESSSGNLGVALSMIAATRGYRFLCVTDSRCNPATRRMMEALGAEVHTVTEPDGEGGFLGARLSHVHDLCAADSRYVWLNQYTNEFNWIAHHRITAPAIAQRFPNLDVLFVGAGTTGTLMGCARYFRESGRPVTVVAVDTVGSVTFGGLPQPRMIPGLGAGVRPQLLDPACIDDVVMVPEPETVRACHRLAAAGFLFGGSTGTVVAGAQRWLARHRPDAELTAVAIAPDLGERYLDTLYQETWVREVYGDDAPLAPLTVTRG
ncbi:MULTISPECIES: 2,3-diaminopropionate biosynthesis protein SbnA [Streptomyces]|uniref:2,3-diaminopropionate biosynthesis protein SbnA n=1 Tax=Streptomyces yunnanensis TaxID=156453 RepID=A0ABY8APD2_9ACTN|nr:MULTISPECIES: 2,3-diaminopropionate biosynthesis protein SbnA [Streptomyces]WEB46011.1 2,3-diaminopropionate biosynthesis protein SbnA [Streptomyces yunnanensis]